MIILLKRFVCNRITNYKQNSSFTDSSGDNELVEHEEMGEDIDEYQYRNQDYYVEDPHFDYNSEREPYKDYW